MADGTVTEGTVLHADLDAFFASVEQRDDPSLRGRPVIVGGGVVMAASYEAKRAGVRTAMGGRQALRICPDAIVVPPRMHAYTQASRDVFDVFHDTTPMVEGLSIDEAFLEVGGLRKIRGLPSSIAAQLRIDVMDRVGLPISVGVARTKYLAKVASAVSKPQGLLVVPIEQEMSFLHALPVERLWGVGKVTSGKLRAARINTVGDVAAMYEQELVQLLGPGSGHHLHALAHNRDPRPVVTGKRRGSMGAQHAIGRGHHTARGARPHAAGSRRPRRRADAVCRSYGEHRDDPAPVRRLHPIDELAHAAAPHLSHAHDPRCRAPAPRIAGGRDRREGHHAGRRLRWIAR